MKINICQMREPNRVPLTFRICRDNINLTWYTGYNKLDVYKSQNAIHYCRKYDGGAQDFSTFYYTGTI